MKNNAATFILLYNDKASVREDIAEFLGMDAFDMEKYASLRRRDSYLEWLPRGADQRDGPLGRVAGKPFAL